MSPTIAANTAAIMNAAFLFIAWLSHVFFSFFSFVFSNPKTHESLGISGVPVQIAL